MKPEIYQCLKMLESLNRSVSHFWNNNINNSASSLQKNYSNICRILEENMTKEEFRKVSLVERVDFRNVPLEDMDNTRDFLMQKLMVSIGITISYLLSLDMNLNKEMVERLEELKIREKELEFKEKHLESLINTYEMLVHPKKGILELVRSNLVGGIKEGHRRIEKNTNPNTKSQGNEK